MPLSIVASLGAQVETTISYPVEHAGEEHSDSSSRIFRQVGYVGT